MSTVREMLPAPVQSFTEIVVGAVLGAAVGYFAGKGKKTATTGALIGSVAGLGLALTKPKGFGPLSRA